MKTECCTAPMSPKMKGFLDLVRLLRERRDHYYTALDDEHEAFDEARCWLDVVRQSIDERDPIETRLENAACLFGAALAIAAVFLQFVSEEQIEAIIATKLESEVES